MCPSLLSACVLNDQGQDLTPSSSSIDGSGDGTPTCAPGILVRPPADPGRRRAEGGLPGGGGGMCPFSQLHESFKPPTLPLSSFYQRYSCCLAPARTKRNTEESARQENTLGAVMAASLFLSFLILVVQHFFSGRVHSNHFARPPRLGTQKGQNGPFFHFFSYFLPT